MRSSSSSSRGNIAQLRRFGRDLALIELACALDAEPLTQRHRQGSGQQAGKTCDEDWRSAGTRAGDAHHEAEVRNEAVVGPEDRRSERVAPDRAMATFEPREDRSARPSGDRSEKAGMRALVVRKRRCGRLGLVVVHRSCRALLPGDDRGDEASATGPREPREDPRANRRVDRAAASSVASSRSRQSAAWRSSLSAIRA